MHCGDVTTLHSSVAQVALLRSDRVWRGAVVRKRVVH